MTKNTNTANSNYTKYPRGIWYSWGDFILTSIMVLSVAECVFLLAIGIVAIIKSLL
jgi:hypothetical protein